ncbi:MAG: tetratricopeptide repeat protein [Promethearchaeota archaeon]
MISTAFFKEYEGNIEDLFAPNEKYTFLVGAGISMDSPTNMPSARQIVKSLLELCAPKEELENLLSLQLLRYELIVEKIQVIFDEELKFMDYLELVTEPNLIHLFLANSIIRGQFVVTTNFDYLIERALMRILPNKSHLNIYPIITKEDYLSLKIPQKLVDTGKYPIYKIHGSKRNIIISMDTRESLITTISALGRDREEGETFAIEPYKKPAVYNLMNKRTLVAMGYSGSDDFDIGPVLKELPYLNRLIWIEHVSNELPEVSVVRQTTKLEDLQNLTHSERLLIEIRSDVDFEVIRIKVNTSNFVRNILWKKIIPYDLTPDVLLSESLTKLPDFHEWLKPIYENVYFVDKYRLACQIFYHLKQLEATYRCSLKGIEIAEKENDQSSKSHFLNFTGMIKMITGDYNEALEYYETALHIDENMKDLSGKASDLNNIGSIYLTWGKYDSAMEQYMEALNMAEQLGDLNGKATNLNNIGRIHEIKGEFDLALEKYNEAIGISEKVGDLEQKAVLLNNIGMIYGAHSNYESALKKYEEALQIADQLGDLYGKIILLNNIGRVHDENKNYNTALERYQQSLLIAEQLGDRAKKAGCLNNVGSIYKALGKYDLAIENYKNALDIEEKLGDPMMKAIYLNNIAMISEIQNDFNSALKNYESALYIVEEIGDFSKKALLLSKIGGIYLTLGNNTISIDKYEEAARIYGEIGDLANNAACLSNLGRIYLSQEKYEKALETFNETLRVDEQLEDDFGKASDLNSIGRIYELIGKFDKALQNYEETLNIFNQIGQAQYADVVKANIDNLKKKIEKI